MLVEPLMRRDEEEVKLFRLRTEDSGAFQLLATTRETYLRAAALRADRGLKLPDAIRVATAAQSSCDIFLNNDSRIRLPEGIERVTLG